MGQSMRFVTVSIPAPHEGIGHALRSIYEAPLIGGLPNDIAVLMNRLNRL